MNKENARTTLSGVWQDNRTLRLALLFLLITNLGLGYALVFKSQIVTIVPSNVMTKSTYSASGADSNALTSWGLYISTLIGNATPANADFVANTMGALLAPSIYHTVMDGIAAQVATIKNDQLTLRFDPAQVKFSSAKNAVYVSGWQTTTDAHGSQQRKERTYEIYFDVVNYQPRVIGLTAYDGEPRL